MYRKNTAGQHLGFGLVNATTGAALTGATVTVYRVIDNGTQATATGTVSEKGNGQYNFALSQADTNGDYISLTFTATNAIPVEKSLVTTVLDPTATSFGLSLAKTTNITGFNDIAATAIVSGGAITTSGGAVSTVTTTTTATNLTNLPSIPANWLTAAGIAASALNGKGDWNVGKTGYSLTPTTGLGNQTADITGNLSGSVGSVTAGVTVATNNDKTGYSLSTAPPTAAAIADAVWDEARSGHTTAGTFGLYLDAQVSTVGGGSLTASAIADAVWDEALSGHTTAGSTGEALNAAGGAGDPWITALPGSYTGSQAGKILADILADTGTDGVVVASGSKTGYSIGSGGITSSSFASNAITAASLATDAVAEIAGQVWEEDRTVHNTAGSFGEGVKTCFGGVGWVNGDVYGGVVGSVGSVAANGISASSLATSAVDEIVDAVWDEPRTAHTTANTFGLFLDAQVSTVGGGSLTASAIADAVWDEARSGHTTAGTFGLYLDAQVSTVGGGSLTAGEIADAVWDEARSGHVTAGTFGEGVIANTVSDKTGYSLATAPPTASAIADAVWDEAQSGHTTVGTFGYYLDGQITAVATGGVSVSAIADAVWDEARSGHVAAGSFGEALQTATGQITAAAAGTVTLPAPYNTGDAVNREIVVDRQPRKLVSHSGSGVYVIEANWATTPTAGADFWLGGLAAPTPSDVWANATRSLTTATPTTTEIADAVWDEARSGHTTAGTFGEGVTVQAVNDKSGYALSATGLDAISVADFAGAANTIPKMIVRLWRRFFAKADKSATQIRTFADDGTTVRTTQAITVSGDDETQGAAS